MYYFKGIVLSGILAFSIAGCTLQRDPEKMESREVYHKCIKKASGSDGKLDGTEFGEMLREMGNARRIIGDEYAVPIFLREGIDFEIRSKSLGAQSSSSSRDRFFVSRKAMENYLSRNK